MELYYISAFTALADEGLKGLMVLLSREVSCAQDNDGRARWAADRCGECRIDEEFRKFIHEMQAHLAAQGCVALLLTGGLPLR